MYVCMYSDDVDSDVDSVNIHHSIYMNNIISVAWAYTITESIIHIHNQKRIASWDTIW